MSTIYVSDKDLLIERLADLSSALNGTSKRVEVSEAVATAIGYAAMSDIHEAFVTKARGGTDKLGIKWQELSPITIARRRVGPNDLKANPEIGKRQRWVKKRAKELLPKFLLVHDEKRASSIAMSVAEREYTRMTGKTKLELLAARTVEILRDTGVLLNSLTPGVLVAGAGKVEYTKPVTHDSEEHQTFVVKPGTVTVGTKVEYADVHQEGSDNIPARPFLPRKEDKIPQAWIDNWKDAVTQALIIVLPRYLKG